jgi:hypothetical protein
MKQIFSEIILIVLNSFTGFQHNHHKCKFRSLGQNSFSILTVSDVHVLYFLFSIISNKS